jgi:hypothetical protein
MFFVMNFVKDVTVSPSDLSKDLTKIIKVKLFEQVTGTCHPKYGYFIKIINSIVCSLRPQAYVLYELCVTVTCLNCSRGIKLIF